MQNFEGRAFKAITRPLRVALYKRSPEFEFDVLAELDRLRTERPDAPQDLARLKLMREHMPAFRRAVWKEAARRLGPSSQMMAAPPPRRAAGPAARSAEGELAPKRASEAPGSPPMCDENMIALATSGEHRVHLWTVGGPGSLMQTLQQLAETGVLTVSTETEERGMPVLVYRPTNLAEPASAPCIERKEPAEPQHALS